MMMRTSGGFMVAQQTFNYIFLRPSFQNRKQDAINTLTHRYGKPRHFALANAKHQK